MFLNQLSEREKKAFLELTVHVSNSNGVFADEEKAMIQEYCKEMEIKEFNMDNIVPLEEIIGEIKKSSLHIKKIILLEILGLVYADGTYDADEKSFVLNFVNFYDIVYYFNLIFNLLNYFEQSFISNIFIMF